MAKEISKNSVTCLYFTRSINLERCQSGRLGRSRKPVWEQSYRGFESLPLRFSSHFKQRNHEALKKRIQRLRRQGGHPLKRKRGLSEHQEEGCFSPAFGPGDPDSLVVSPTWQSLGPRLYEPPA